jgi:hypothetical protein
MRGFVFAFALMFAPAAAAQTLDDLSWLTGCWRTATTGAAGGGVVTEVWVRPPMPAMLGYSYTVGEGETQAWEQTRIEMIDGWPHFVAMPNGAAPVRFRLREGDGENLARFDNAEHDYPQTVAYRREGARLIATISKADGSDAVSFQYRRVRCERTR